MTSAASSDGHRTAAIPGTARARGLRGSEAPSKAGLRVVGTFLTATFAVTWVLWTPLVLLGDRAPSAVAAILTMVGSLVPSAVAIVLMAATRDRAGLREVRARLCLVRVGARWYAAVLCIPLLVPMAVIAAASLGGEAPEVDVTVVGAAAIFLFSIFPGSALGEELGWRGLLLPRLLDRHSPFTSSVVVGSIWGFWHLPLWMVGAEARPIAVFPIFVVSTVAMSVIMTWMHLGTGGSLFVIVLYHAAANLPLTLLVAPLGSSMALPFAISTALLVAAAGLVVRAGGSSTWMSRPVPPP